MTTRPAADKEHTTSCRTPLVPSRSPPSSTARRTRRRRTYARTAFLVILNADGSLVVHPDVNYNLSLERYPHPDEIQGATAVIAADIAAQKAGMATHSLMMQSAQSAMQQHQMQQQASAALHKMQADPRFRQRG